MINKRHFQTKKHLKDELIRIIDTSIDKSFSYVNRELDIAVDRITAIDFDEIYIHPPKWEAC